MKDIIRDDAGTVVGRIEETIMGYVPVRIDIMGLETGRGPEMDFRISAVEWLEGVE